MYKQINKNNILYNVYYNHNVEVTKITKQSNNCEYEYVPKESSEYKDIYETFENGHYLAYKLTNII